MEEPQQLQSKIKAKDLPGAIKVMPMGLDAAIKKRVSGEFKSEKTSSGMSFSQTSNNQTLQTPSFDSPDFSSPSVNFKEMDQLMSNSTKKTTMSGFQCQSSMSSQKVTSSQSTKSEFSSSFNSQQSYGGSSSFNSQQSYGGGSSMLANTQQQMLDNSQHPIMSNQQQALHGVEIKNQNLKSQIRSAIYDLENEIGPEFEKEIKSPTPVKTDLFSPPPLERISEPKISALPSFDNPMSNGHASFNTSETKGVNMELHKIQEESNSMKTNGTYEESSSFQRQETGTHSSLLNKIMTPVPPEFDSGSLKRRDPKKMFTDSSFYSAAHHPTVGDEVERAHKISSALFNEDNQSSKGQQMYLNRAKRSGEIIDDDVAAPKHDKNPDLKKFMNPEGKVQDWSDVAPEDLPNEARVAAHANANAELPAPLIDSGSGRGGELFAKRRKKAENWVVDENTIGQDKPSNFADKLMQKKMIGQQKFEQGQQAEQEQNQQISQQQHSQVTSQQQFQQQTSSKQSQSLEIRCQQEIQQLTMNQQQLDLPDNFQHCTLLNKCFTPTFDTSCHNVQGINVWANTAPRGWTSSGMFEQKTIHRVATPSMDSNNRLELKSSSLQITQEKNRMMQQQEEQRMEQQQIEQQRLEQQKMEQHQMEQQRLEQQKVEHQRFEQQNLEQQRMEQQRMEQQRIEQQRQEEQRLEQQRIEQHQMEQHRIEEQRVEQQRMEQKRAEEQRLEQQRLEQQRIEQQRIEQQLMEKRRIEEERLEQQRLEQQRIEEQRLEQQRIEQQRMEQQRIEQQRMEQQRIEQQRMEQQRIEQQRMEQQRIEQQRMEQQQMEQRRIEEQRLEQQRMEQQRMEQQRMEQQRMEQQRMEQQRMEQQRMEQQRMEQQRMEQQRMEQQKMEQQKMEQQRMEQQRMEQQRMEQQRMEQQRVEEQKRMENQRIEQQQMEHQRMEVQSTEQQRMDQGSMEQPSQLQGKIQAKDLPGAFNVMPQGLDAAIQKRVSGEFKSKRSSSAMSHSQTSNSQVMAQQQISVQQQQQTSSSKQQWQSTEKTSQASSISSSKTMMSSNQVDLEPEKRHEYEAWFKNQEREAMEYSASVKYQEKGSECKKTTTTVTSTEQNIQQTKQNFQQTTQNVQQTNQMQGDFQSEGMMKTSSLQSNAMPEVKPSLLFAETDSIQRPKSAGILCQMSEESNNKLMNKWDNHNAIARGWGGMKENYHPVTFREIYNVDSQTTHKL